MQSKKIASRAERSRAKALKRKYYKSIRKTAGGEGLRSPEEQPKQRKQSETVSVPDGARADDRVDLEEEDRGLGHNNKRNRKCPECAIALKRKKWEKMDKERLKIMREREAEKSRHLEKRKKRNAIMRQSTKRGQPVMKGRIGLLLEDIEASLS